MLLQTQNLSVRFGGLTAVDAVNFSLPRGQIRALIGPNGAGKTTFFNAVSGRFKPSGGAVVFDGREITGWEPRNIARLGLVRTFQISSVFLGLTASENVWIACHSGTTLWNSIVRVKTRKMISARVDEVLDTVGLTHVARERVSTLSYGDQRVLEVALALALRPKLLLLDEPTAGMSPAETHKMSELVRKLRSEVGVVIVEHDMEMIMGLADHISVFDRGRLIAEGSPNEIRDNDTVRRIYLGTAEC